MLVALRESVGRRVLNLEADPRFREEAQKLGKLGLTRAEVPDWVLKVTGYQLNTDHLRNVETSRSRNPSPALIKALLTAYGLSVHEVRAVLDDPNLNAVSGANPHLIAGWRMRNLAIGEFGPAIGDALRVGDQVSTWLEVEKAASGGFMPGEINVVVEASEVAPPDDFKNLANQALAQNEQKKADGVRGWTDNPTFCLLSAKGMPGVSRDEPDFAVRSIVTDLGKDVEERPHLTLRLQHSWYRYNVIAKQAAGAGHRWRTLQEATIPLKPVAFLASGIGVCVNVICDDAKSIVIGQRSFDETFRKGEYDIAVVEGIRPGAEGAGSTTIHDAAYRALSEELGVNRSILKRPLEDIIKRLVIFEFGCDLEFYQFNFLAFAEVDLDFDTLYGAWQKAKDRKENQTLHKVSFDEGSVKRFIAERPIWSSGAACALRTFDYF
ncbi:helix-turn-helix domain-containing protein [Bradyrhizobium sp. 21]|nr:helix-turn-helix domain-containing protein [Bradyrhizobium sp. 21]